MPVQNTCCILSQNIRNIDLQNTIFPCPFLSIIPLMFRCKTKSKVHICPVDGDLHLDLGISYLLICCPMSSAKLSNWHK